MKLEKKAEGVYVIHNFLTNKECEEYINKSEKIGYHSSALRSVKGKAVQIKELRNNYRVITDDHNSAKYLWNKLENSLPNLVSDWKAIGLNEKFRYYRYNSGELFDWHSDGYFERNSNERSYMTFMIYLSENFKGGDTKFKKFNIKPVKGMALLFMHNLVHQGAPVSKGTKYVLRSDVMYSKL